MQCAAVNTCRDVINEPPNELRLEKQYEILRWKIVNNVKCYYLTASARYPIIITVKKQCHPVHMNIHFLNYYKIYTIIL